MKEYFKIFFSQKFAWYDYLLIPITIILGRFVNDGQWTLFWYGDLILIGYIVIKYAALAFVKYKKNCGA